ncbi:VC0807 family protein [Sphaerisporangium fuscum]|uniref:VC0807 family protein n=1 Tax=Sphaerisporangium fuscum TaxID=2835868 RepID=UPI001BDCD5A3|nr:VC0807 family protein [Sphaerisporangium fuscum]
MAQTTIPEATAKPQGNPLIQTLKPLVLDVAVPLGTYYLLKDGLGLDLLTSLALSSVVPAVRTLAGIVRDRTFNGLAGLMLVVNVAGILLTFVAGDARLMMAKDSAISSVIGLSILVSAFRGRPLMSAGLKPFVTKGDPVRTAAWDRLSAGSQRFRRAERLYSMIWGGALLAECAARIIGAFTLPISTMVWLSTVMLIGAIVLAMIVSGGAAFDPMQKMIDAEARKA